MFNVNGTL